MDRNVNSRFSIVPSNDNVQRSVMDLNSDYKSSGNVGSLLPFYWEPVLPGDTFSVKTSKVVRFQTMIAPCMSNMYLDTFFFYVPNRLVWEHWKEFCGENNSNAWIPTVEYSEPQVVAESGFAVGSLGDYMGLPVNVPCSVSALPFRAYAKVVEDWFRSEAVQDPVNIYIGDSDTIHVKDGYDPEDPDGYIDGLCKGNAPFVVAKYFDAFTSGLPSPQKGPDVFINVADAGMFPVITGDRINVESPRPLTWMDGYGTEIVPDGVTRLGINGDGNTYVGASSGSNSGTPIRPSNLWADASGFTQATTINQLRMAFQVQRFFERQARSGSRYIETIKAFFNVTSPDARLQRSEYLGGNRIPINVNQVIQQSGTTDSSPLGETGAMSLTTDVHGDFSKSFTEHGIVLGVMCVRYDHSYQQGIDRKWSRKTKFDYYWPVFAHLGEQAILRKEIYATGDPEKDNEVFAYQEAWWEYRYSNDKITGEMRSGIPNSLDVWHLGDYYESTPYLSNEWLREDKKNVDRILSVSSDLAHQFWFDIYTVNKATRPMPLYSTPGLIDHF